MSIDEMIAVLQAFKEGKKIEYKGSGVKDWFTVDNTVNLFWNFYAFEYRIKQGESKKPRTFWVVTFKGHQLPIAIFANVGLAVSFIWNRPEPECHEYFPVEEILPTQKVNIME